MRYLPVSKVILDGFSNKVIKQLVVKMKYKKNIILCCMIISFFTMSLNLIPIYAQQYSYPQEYTSEEWKSLSPDEKEAKFQIPDKILSDIHTEELIQAYLDHPLIGFIYAYNNRQKGFKVFRDKFNVIHEIFRRPDSGIKLIEFYKKMDPSAYNTNWPPLEMGNFTHDILHIEILLSQEPILSKLQKSEERSLVLESMNKLEVKKIHSNEFRQHHREITAYLLAKIIYLKGETNGLQQRLSQIPGMKYFLNTVRFPNNQIETEIFQISEQFIESY